MAYSLILAACSGDSSFIDILQPVIICVTSLIANVMGPIWDRQDPTGPRVGPTNLAIWDYLCRYSHFTDISTISSKFYDSVKTRFCFMTVFTNYYITESFSDIGNHVQHFLSSIWVFTTASAPQMNMFWPMLMDKDLYKCRRITLGNAY